MQSYYDSNMECIREIDKVLFDAINTYDGNEEDVRLETAEAKDGSRITIITKAGRRQYMNSAYNPVKEAKQFVSQYESKVVDYSVMIMFGFGNGLIASMLLKELPKNVRFMFYEPSTDIFMYTLQNYDLRGILNDKRIRLIVKGMNDTLTETEITSYIDVENYRIIFFDSLPKYARLYEEEYEFLKESYQDAVRGVKSNIYTNKFFDTDMARNDIYNMRHFLHNASLAEDYEGAFPKEATAILVAAGPSLEKNIHELKRAKGQALIIAVDTALKYMVSQGIYPDVVVMADARKPIQLFEDENLRQTSLAIITAANYRVVEFMKGKIIYVSSGAAYYNKMMKLVGRTMYNLNKGGSVSTVAFSLAVEWGFRRFILVGQDLSIDDNKLYAGDKSYESPDDCIEVEGYYGEKVYTLPVFEDYKKWYEMIIRQDDNIEVINATEGGARIKGTLQMTLEDAIDQYCHHEFDYEGTIKNMKPAIAVDQKKLIVECWKESVINLDALNKELGAGKERIDHRLNRINKDSRDYEKLCELNDYLKDMVKRWNDMEEIYFLDVIQSKYTADILGDLYEAETDGVDEHYRILKKMSDYISLMRDAVADVKKLFETIIQDSEQEQMFLNEV